VALPPPPPTAARSTFAAPAAWQPGVPERHWRWIVIHHSDDTKGCAAKYDEVHRGKGWDGLGYHFVIGNGSQTGDGSVEVGYRWARQEHGAHARKDPTDDNRFNEYGIGIVLVGNFEGCGGPTPAQYRAVVNLTRWLMERYAITPDRVLRHCDVKQTCCPGRQFPWSRFVSDVSAPPTEPTVP
jgi:N-acetyl-anhydromuramyl-L-alanine amidase AmpD